MAANQAWSEQEVHSRLTDLDNTIRMILSYLNFDDFASPSDIDVCHVYQL